MKGQRGFTLAELVVAFFILGVIAVVLGAVIQQMLTVPEKGNAQVEASHTLQDVINTMSYDVMDAEEAATGSTLTLTMPDTRIITYSLSGTDLVRSVDGVNETIAANISSLSFTMDNRVISMSITSTPESRWSISGSFTYQVAMRSSG